MNGELATTAASLGGSRTLTVVANGPGTFLRQGRATVPGRPLRAQPTDAESKRLVGYVESGGPGEGREGGRWPTCSGRCSNSTEFAVNH